MRRRPIYYTHTCLFMFGDDDSFFVYSSRSLCLLMLPPVCEPHQSRLFQWLLQDLDEERWSSWSSGELEGLGVVAVAQVAFRHVDIRGYLIRICCVLLMGCMPN